MSQPESSACLWMRTLYEAFLGRQDAFIPERDLSLDYVPHTPEDRRPLAGIGIASLDDFSPTSPQHSGYERPSPCRRPLRQELAALMEA